MSYQITLQPSGRAFAANDDETLLEAADRAGLALPYGCRNGACSVCKATLKSGQIDHGASQDWALPPEQRAENKLLLCCAKAQSDLVVEVREVSPHPELKPRILPCRVHRMEKLAPDVMRIMLKLPASERLQFLAGQYIEFILKDGSRRAFSLANGPATEGELEVHVRLVTGGQFTTHVFEGMKEKDILRFEGPLGTFYLREDSAKPLILLAGGTGFAPIKALMEQLIEQKSTRPVHLYWGARDRAGLYLPELPAQWQSAYPALSYVPVLSDATEADGWSGRRGLVHQAVLEDFADLSGFEVYACGAPIMIEAAQRDFAARGLPGEAFFADAFTFAPPTAA